MNVDRSIEQCRNGKVLTEEKLCRLLRNVKSILMEEPNVLRLKSPVKIVGRIVGQYGDLLKLFRIGGEPSSTNPYLFLGGYVNRGKHSVLTMTYLFLLKLKYPKSVFLLRGSEEDGEVSRYCGYYEELNVYYGRSRAWIHSMEAFICLPIAAVLDNNIYCVHSGLSPECPCIDKLQSVDRCIASLTQGEDWGGIIQDSVLSEPEEELETWGCSRESWLFGHRVAKEFCELNNVETICRTRNFWAREGYKYNFKDKSCLSILSAPNLSYLRNRGNVPENQGCFLKVGYHENSSSSIEMIQFDSSHMNDRMVDVFADEKKYGLYRYDRTSADYFRFDLYKLMFQEKTEKHQNKWKQISKKDDEERNTFLIDQMMNVVHHENEYLGKKVDQSFFIKLKMYNQNLHFFKFFLHQTL